jgi:hypothetical protein
MIAVRFLALLLIVLAASSAEAKAPRGAPAAGASEQAILNRMKQQPLIFFVAKGSPNSCGANCNTWIAVEGSIDQEAAERFRAFLQDPARRRLPVFFNSSGGSTGQAVVIGMLLRQYRMTAGVGRTIPEGCPAALVMGPACRRTAQSKPEHQARLVTAGTRCASGCVYAMLGASVRQVARDAVLGIHSVRYIWSSSSEALPRAASATEIVHEGLRNYVVEMGVDPGLIDAAAKVSPDRLHWLTRSEIERFGLETRGFHETRWRMLQETAEIFSISKSFTRADGNNDYRTTEIRLRCSNVSGYLMIYRSELPLFEADARLQVRALLGDGDLRFTSVAEPGGSVSYATVNRDLLQAAAAKPKLEFTEARDANAPRLFGLSTAGFSEALSQLQKRCDQYRESGASATKIN